MKSGLWLLCALLLVGCGFITSASASTAAFAGTVVAIGSPTAKQKDTLKSFTVRFDYLDYISWSKFGRSTKAGESITRWVKKLGTLGMINGRPVNALTFSRAIRPGLWGYFYEDTWLDLQTTPNFLWGEIVAMDRKQRKLTLRIYSTHKEHHLAANPPREKIIAFDDDLTFRIEAEPAKPEKALKPGHWIQLHPPRPQMLSVWSEAAAFNPKELLPAEEGKRGFANRLSCPGVLKSVELPRPEGVIDLPATLTVDRFLHGKWQEAILKCKKTTFILDGKVCPANIAARPGRRVVLGHYRKEKAPHKVFVRSHDDAVRGLIVSVKDNAIQVKTRGTTVGVPREKDAIYHLNGIPGPAKEAMRAGREITVYPSRGKTLVAFPPVR